jgi:alpha-glucuronidase
VCSLTQSIIFKQRNTSNPLNNKDLNPKPNVIKNPRRELRLLNGWQYLTSHIDAPKNPDDIFFNEVVQALQ